MLDSIIVYLKRKILVYNESLKVTNGLLNYSDQRITQFVYVLGRIKEDTREFE